MLVNKDTTLKTPIAINKKCSCGVIHCMIPVGAKPQLANNQTIGWTWPCVCKSHILVFTMSKEEIKRLIALEDVA